MPPNTLTPSWGVSSVELDDGDGELDGGEGVARGPVVTGRDGEVVLQRAEEALRRMAGLVERAVILMRDVAITFGAASQLDYTNASVVLVRGANQGRFLASWHGFCCPLVAE